MATGRIRRSARRGLAAAVLGWLGVAAVSVLMAPQRQRGVARTTVAHQGPHPAGGLGRQGRHGHLHQQDPRQDRQVGGGRAASSRALVSVTAKTEVTLTLPSGDHPWGRRPTRCSPDGSRLGRGLQRPPARPARSPTATAVERQLPAPSAITVSGDQHAAARCRCPTPFVVNTLVPLPNAARAWTCRSCRRSSCRARRRPLPSCPPSVPTVPAVPSGGTVVPQASAAGVPTIAGHPGPHLRVHDRRRRAPAVAGRRRRRLGVRPVAVLRHGGSSGSGSGGEWRRLRARGRQLRRRLGAGLRSARRPTARSRTTGRASDSASTGQSAQTLPAAPLAAVVALAAVTAALVRTHQASRAAPLTALRSRPSSPRGRRPLRRVRGALWTARTAVRRTLVASSCAFRRPAGARNACTTLLLQTFCSRQDQRRWGFPCVITN